MARSSTNGVPPRMLIDHAACLIVLLLMFAIVARLAQGRRPLEDFESPDDVRVARERFAEKFTGPRRVQTEATTDGIPYPCIPADSPRRQMAGTVATRRLLPDAIDKLDKLVSKFDQNRPSRRRFMTLSPTSPSRKSAASLMMSSARFMPLWRCSPRRLKSAATRRTGSIFRKPVSPTNASGVAPGLLP